MKRQFVAMKAFIINEENDTIFLMQKGTKDALNPEKWEIPGGKINFYETITAALKREVKEECGLDIEVGTSIIKPWQWTFSKSDVEEIQIIAVGKVCRALSQVIDYSHQTDTDDLIEGRWVHISKILYYDLIPNLIPTMQYFVNLYFELKAKNLPVFEAEKESDMYNYCYTKTLTSKYR